MRGLPWVDGTGVSLSAAPTPSFVIVGPCWWPWWFPTKGRGFKSPWVCCDCCGAESFDVGALRGAAGAATDGNDASADAGRVTSPLGIGRAVSGAGMVILLIRTFFAIIECWLYRRGELLEVALWVRGRVEVGPGKAAMVDR